MARPQARHLTFVEHGEYSIEIDPRTVNEAAIAELRDMEFTIAVLGMPDLEPSVLEAVTRPQPAQLTLDAIAAARRAGFPTVGVDAMYGLPRRTAATFTRTLRAIVLAQPDRVTLHDYVHAPRRHKAQRQVSFHELPRASDRLEMLGLAVECVTSAGYVHVGADRFVTARDALASACAAERLHYDMLGYSAAGEMDIVPAGVSAVVATELAYTQNESDLGAYYDRLGDGLLPVARGILLSPDDMLRRTECACCCAAPVARTPTSRRNTSFLSSAISAPSCRRWSRPGRPGSCVSKGGPSSWSPVAACGCAIYARSSAVTPSPDARYACQKRPLVLM